MPTIALWVKVDEIADLADKAVAAEAYFRQSQDVENEMQASRIRARAERRLGEILKRMAETGERKIRGNAVKSRGATSLDDLGIPKDRASRAMQLAEVPQEQFEAALAVPEVAQPRKILRELRVPGKAVTARQCPVLDPQMPHSATSCTRSENTSRQALVGGRGRPMRRSWPSSA